MLALMTEVGSRLSAARTALSAVNEKPKFRKTSAEVFSKLQPKFLPEVFGSASRSAFADRLAGIPKF